MTTLMTILAWVAIVSGLAAITLFCIGFVWAIAAAVYECKCRHDLERITPSNEELLAKVEENPPWLQEWLDEDMEGMF